MFLELLSYIGMVVGFLFLVLSIASGLYYISELVEEHTEPTKRFLKKLIYSIMVTLLLLVLFDKFPIKLTLFSIFSHYIYLQNLVKFPYVEFTSPIFLASVVLVIANHFLWFNHFHNPEIPSLEARLKPDYVPPTIPSFSQVCSFFGLLIWFIPFALFISLSAHDNLLPHHNDVDTSTSEFGKKKNNGLAKVAVTTLRDYVYGISRKFGYELDPHRGSIVY